LKTTIILTEVVGVLLPNGVGYKTLYAYKALI